MARRTTTPRSSDAAVRFLKLCVKKSKRALTAASGSVAVMCTCSVAWGRRLKARMSKSVGFHESKLEGDTHRRLKKADIRQGLHVHVYICGRHRVVKCNCKPFGEGGLVNCLLGAPHEHRQHHHRQQPLAGSKWG